MFFQIHSGNSYIYGGNCIKTTRGVKMKIVFIAEKPLMAQAIATALSPSYQKKDGYLERSNHLIFTWALGHLVELSEFEVYDEK